MGEGKTIAEKTKPIWCFAQACLDWWAGLFLAIPTFIGLGISVFPSTVSRIIVVFSKEITIASILLYLAVFFGVVGGMGAISKRKSLVRLETENERLRENAIKYDRDTKLLLEDFLRDLAFDCGLSNEKQGLPTDIRITIYWHDDIDRVFVPVARVSGNPVFSSFGRATISDTQGVISKGWGNRFYRHQSSVNTEEDWIKDQVDNHNFAEEEARSIKMKSLSILAWRLEYEHQPIGVMVIESTRKTKAGFDIKAKVENSRQFSPIMRAVYRIRESHLQKLTTNTTNLHPVPLAS